MENKPLISIVLPCLNEEAGIVFCLEEIQKTITNNSLSAEVIIVDNNSHDNSVKIINDFQTHFPELKLVHEQKEGYGFAYLKGLETAVGEYIFMADSDGTYKFSDIPEFINKLTSGADLVVGDRFSKKISHKEMPWLNHYIGNPFLSSLVRIFFKVKINDIHCGARAIRKEALKKINLYTGGMEFASEMIIKAAQQNLTIREIPIEYRARIGSSKLRTLTDGWRHLRFILLYSPLFLFFIPGAIFFILGIIFTGIFYFSSPNILGVQFYVHPMFLFSLMIILGYQLILFSGFSKVYAITHLGDNDKLIESLFKKITIEKAGLLGFLIAILGGIIYLSIFIGWIKSGFGAISEIKESIIGLSLLILGIQTFFSAFMFSILGIKNK